MQAIAATPSNTPVLSPLLQPLSWCGRKWSALTAIDENANACQKTCALITRILPGLLLIIASLVATIPAFIEALRQSYCVEQAVPSSTTSYATILSAERPEAGATLHQLGFDGLNPNHVDQLKERLIERLPSNLFDSIALNYLENRTEGATNSYELFLSVKEREPLKPLDLIIETFQNRSLTPTAQVSPVPPAVLLDFILLTDHRTPADNPPLQDARNTAQTFISTLNTIQISIPITYQSIDIQIVR